MMSETPTMTKSSQHLRTRVEDEDNDEDVDDEDDEEDAEDKVVPGIGEVGNKPHRQKFETSLKEENYSKDPEEVEDD